jgi:molybdopterin-guanine dinucleotide biosynthesis protein A
MRAKIESMLEPVFIRIETSLRAKLKKLAQSEGISFSQLISNAAAMYLSVRSKKPLQMANGRATFAEVAGAFKVSRQWAHAKIMQFRKSKAA